MDIVFVAFIGLCFGSFATVLIYRIPRGLPWAFEGGSSLRSRCSSCQTVLGAVDLIPVLSWIFNRGRCRHCGAKVSAFYPLVEIFSSGVLVAVYLVFKAFWA
jgi:prepilin signal peptidase PulO-like enzyme (type II secretory pathway)